MFPFLKSFKDSLLKSAKQTKPPSIPVGKSIWDVMSVAAPVPTKTVVTAEPELKKNVITYNPLTLFEPITDFRSR